MSEKKRMSEEELEKRLKRAGRISGLNYIPGLREAIDSLGGNGIPGLREAILSLGGNPEGPSLEVEARLLRLNRKPEEKSEQEDYQPKPSGYESDD